MKWSVHYQSISKPDSAGQNLNEDSIRVDEGKGLFYLSDGAGGTGINSQGWSNYLVNKLPETPLNNFEYLLEWFNGIWEEYFDSTKNQLIEYQSDLLYKFYSEGSAATVAALWVVENNASFFAYGDSMFMHFSGKDGTLIGSNMRLEDYLERPYLLNFLDEPYQDAGVYRSHELSEGDIVILASDAMGQYLLGLYHLYHRTKETDRTLSEIYSTPFRYANLLERLDAYVGSEVVKSWGEELNQLWDALEGEGSFRGYAKARLDDGRLVLDDYSVIMIKFNRSAVY